jgi:hypothetical protein
MDERDHKAMNEELNHPLQQCSVSLRSETIKNFGKILDIMNRYKQEVDNGIYDHKETMIEEIISRFTIVSNSG